MGRTRMVVPVRNTGLLPGLHFLCRFFWGPAPGHCLEMTRDGFPGAFDALEPALPVPAQEAAAAIRTFLEARPDADLLCRDLQTVYASLFLGGRAAGSAPLHQSCYLFEDAPLMGPPALRMQERLASAGLSVAGEGNQPPDHLAVELEYLYFLLSRAREGADPALKTRAAEFAKTELCSWLPLFSDRLGRIPDSAPYNDAAVLALYLSRLIAGE
jgi:TorA-specific chaperone